MTLWEENQMQAGALNDQQAQSGALGAALEREHREIDAGIDAFRVGSTNDQSQAEAAAAPLTGAIVALRRHIYLEEEFLFPAMQAEFAIPIGVMLREHGEIWRTLATLETKLDQRAEQSGVLSACEELTEQLERHNSKEEPIFYTQADRSLTGEQSAELEAFMRSGQMPPGWTCQAVRS